MPWHDDDNFWHGFSPALFTPQRLEAAADEVSGVLALADALPGMRVLDLCCGPGRHSLEFARRGFSVTGVDRTRRYLDQADRAAAEQGLELELVQADMRQFERAEGFDLAINLFTSFAYFEDPADDLTVARKLYRSLAPGGVLVMDMMGKEVLARVFQEKHWEELADGSVLIQRHRVLDSWGRMEGRWKLVRQGQVEEFAVTHRLYSATELCALLEQAGFAIAEAFGGLDGCPYDHQAERLIALARK